MKIRYNSPVVLTFAILYLVFLTLPVAKTMGLNPASPARLAFSDIQFYPRLFTHVFQHGSWSHFMGNFMIILFVGPLLEEKYGSWLLFEMMAVTAVVTALVNAAVFHTSLIGASGLGFMMIRLSSFANFKARQIPLTFILVAVLYIGFEVAAILKVDQILQFSHLAGGFFGAAFGFLRVGKR